MATKTAVQLVCVSSRSNNWIFYTPSSDETSFKFSININRSTLLECYIEVLELNFMTVADVCHFKDICYSVCQSSQIQVIFKDGFPNLDLFQLFEMFRNFEAIYCDNLYFTAFSYERNDPRTIEVLA